MPRSLTRSGGSASCWTTSATEPPDDADISDLRALLYGLHAILRLHTTQEDESYLSLAEDAAKV